MRGLYILLSFAFFVAIVATIGSPSITGFSILEDIERDFPPEFRAEYFDYEYFQSLETEEEREEYYFQLEEDYQYYLDEYETTSGSSNNPPFDPPEEEDDFEEENTTNEEPEPTTDPNTDPEEEQEEYTDEVNETVEEFLEEFEDEENETEIVDYNETDDFFENETHNETFEENIIEEENTTCEEFIDMSGERINEIKLIERRIIELQEVAREQNDIIKVNCVKDKLTQVKTLIRLAQTAQEELTEKTNQEECTFEFSRITVALEQVSILREEAMMCISEEVNFPDTIVEETIIDEDIPINIIGEEKFIPTKPITEGEPEDFVEKKRELVEEKKERREDQQSKRKEKTEEEQERQDIVIEAYERVQEVNVRETSFEKRQERAQEIVSTKKELIVEENNITNETISTVVIVVEVSEDENITIIEDIPKEIAADVSELTFSRQPIILEADPVVMWHLDDIEEPVELSYSVNKEIQTTGNTILLAQEQERKPINWTGSLPLFLIPIIIAVIVYFSQYKRRLKE